MYVLDIRLKCDFYKFYFAASAYPDEKNVIRREILSFCQQIRFRL